MFKSKFNLYNSEWLEFVFSERNKSYGAYQLRQHYNSNILKALFFTVTFFSVVLLASSILTKHQPDTANSPKHDEETLINLTSLKPPPEAAPAKAHKTQTQAATTVQKAAPSQQMKVVPDELAKTDSKPIVAQNVIAGLENNLGDNFAELNTTAAGGGTTTATDKGTDNEPKNVTLLEKLPEFPGGMDGWSKFLNKNMRYPEQAASAGVSGRVCMSFIVEKDGKITHVEVMRGIGFGCDEEAIRVLKLAPAWKPGIQNGQPVRVKYTIPINFTIQE